MILKILLDENLPHDLRSLLVNHDVYTVSYMGWNGVVNGDLLQHAGDDEFEVLITKDSGIAYEQHLQALPVAVVILKAKTNKLEDIRPLLPELLNTLGHISAKTVVRIG